MKYRVDSPICTTLNLEDFLNELDDDGWVVDSVQYVGQTEQVERVACYSADRGYVEFVKNLWYVISRKKRWWE